MTIEAILSDILTELRILNGAMAVPAPTMAEVCEQYGASVAVPLPPTASLVPPPPPLPVTVAVPPPPPTAVFGTSVATTSAPLQAEVNAAMRAAVELDAKGMPWDGRIHASSKAKIADGTWRAKRGVDPALVTEVTAELQQAVVAPAAALPGVPWPFPEPGVPQPPVATFAALMSVLPRLVAGGELPNEKLMAALATHGLTSVPALGARPDLVPAVVATLGITL